MSGPTGRKKERKKHKAAVIMGAFKHAKPEDYPFILRRFEANLLGTRRRMDLKCLSKELREKLVIEAGGFKETARGEDYLVKEGINYKNIEHFPTGALGAVPKEELVEILAYCYDWLTIWQKGLDDLQSENEELQKRLHKQPADKKLYSSSHPLPKVKNDEVRRFMIKGNKDLPSDLLRTMGEGEYKVTTYSQKPLEFKTNITYKEEVLAAVCILVRDYEAGRHYYNYHIRRYTGVDGTRGPAHIIPEQLIPSYGKFLSDGELLIPRRKGPGDELVSLLRIEMMNIDKLIEGTK